MYIIYIWQENLKHLKKDQNQRNDQEYIKNQKIKMKSVALKNITDKEDNGNNT